MSNTDLSGTAAGLKRNTWEQVLLLVTDKFYYIGRHLLHLGAKLVGGRCN